jgi:hypothetical protein
LWSRGFGEVILLSTLAISCAPDRAAAKDTVVVKNLVSGLVCGDGGGDRRVCFQSEDVFVTGESSCVYAGRTAPCTWYGFSFDYELAKDAVTLQCSWSSTDRGSVGNPSEELAQEVNNASYEIELTRGENSFFNPQYSVLPTPLQEKGKVTRIEQSCSFQGVSLFEVTFTLHYPER